MDVFIFYFLNGVAREFEIAFDRGGEGRGGGEKKNTPHLRLIHCER